MEKQAYETLKAKLRIDNLRLDEELEEMASLVMEVGEHCARAISARDAVKHDLEDATAAAADRIRRTPETDRYGKEVLPSETRVSAKVPLDRDVKKQRIVLEDAEYDVSLWRSLVDAMRAKKDTLTKMCDMVMSGYLTPNSMIEQRRNEIREHGRQRRQVR